MLRHELGEDRGQPDRLRAQLAPDRFLARCREVALVEHQVEGRQHAIESPRQLVSGRNAIGNAGLADLPFRPNQALGERYFGHEKCPGDLRCRQAAQGPECQGNARVERQGWVTAGEDEPEAIVLQAVLSPELHAIHLRAGVTPQLLELLRLPAFAPDPIQCPIPAGGSQPGRGIGWDAVAWPRLQRGCEGLGERLFRGIEVAAQEPDEGREHASVGFAIGVLDSRVRARAGWRCLRAHWLS